MHFLTVEQMRAADQAAITDRRIAEKVLMSRAGTALARVVEKVAFLRGVKSVVVIAGHGNNGGDACVAARCLYEDGFHVQVLMTCVPASLKGTAREAWVEMRTKGVPYLVGRKTRMCFRERCCVTESSSTAYWAQDVKARRLVRQRKRSCG